MFVMFFGVKQCFTHPCKFRLFNTEQEVTEYLNNNAPKRNQQFFQIYYGKYISFRAYYPNITNSTSKK